MIMLKQFGVAVLYALFAYIASFYFKSDTVASVFHPTSGLALAVLLIGGVRYAWAISLGELLFSVISSSPLWVAVATTLGNTLGPLLGAWLLTREGRFDLHLRSLRDYLRLILLGSVGNAIADPIGSMALLVSGLPTAENYFRHVSHWWMGDTLGIILITPLLLVWRPTENDYLKMIRAPEAVFLLGLTFLAGQAVFLDWFHDSIGQVTRGYWMFLFIAWVALRLGPRGTVVALAMTATQALLGGHYETGFFADDIVATNLTNYWLYMVILSVVGMALATYFVERNLAENQLRDLSAHLQEIREEEKASIAREIHDDLGGTLTAIRMEIYWLARGLPPGKESTPLFECIESMSLLLDNAMSVTRRVMTELRPAILDDLGLLAAIEWQAAQFQKRTGIECRVNCIEDKGKLDRQHSIALFRIFQEALTNVVRHSGASRVEVEFHHSEDEVALSISDNGHGIPGGHAIAPDSYGIRGMFERVGQLGGRIRFDSQPGGGFNVAVILPLSDNYQKEEKA
ncbi:MAG TPA: MASE1 domain-containing protein [Gallionella sp.]|nr:MASE1 domain-containing protein [Gallionella sp.]